MKYRTHVPSGKAQSMLLRISALALSTLALSSSAQIVTLADQNSLAQINTGTQQGMYNWSVDGQNQLVKQWFWYRVGSSGPESSIDTLSLPLNTVVDPRTLDSAYFNPTLGYGVDVRYHLTGNLPGSGSSVIGEAITITNGTANSIVFHFYQYSDFNLSGPGGDKVTLIRGVDGKFKEAQQVNATTSLSESLDATLVTHADHGAATNSPVTLNQLNDAFPTTLQDTTSFGPGDATWAFEWDLTIGAGQSTILSKNLSLQVPEPGSVGLVCLGAVGAVFGWRRTRRKA
jgi:hypothetical protein